MKHCLEVWQVVDSRNFGGIESHILQLAKAIHLQHVAVKVVFLADYGEHPLYHQLLSHNIQVLVCGKQSLLSLIKQYQPSLLHTHGYKAGMMGRIVGMLTSTPVISTFHAGEKTSGRMKMYDLLDRYSSFLTKHCYAVSQEIKQRIPFSASVAKNFVECKATSINTGGHVAFVGRLSKEKGTDFLIEIAKLQPNIDIHVYGDGPEKEQLRQAKCNNLILHGQVNNMVDVWPSINLLLQPSINEGLPMSVLEAMSFGIPVIASQVGDLPYVISHGENGWLVPVGDTEQVSTLMFDWLHMDACRQHDLKCSARQTIEDNYSAQVVVPDIIHQYQLASQ